VKVRTGKLHEWLAERKIELVLVLAYGRILPRAVLEAPALGCINLHASLLPKLRGAAPIQWAIMRGEQKTGVSLMHMDEGLDTGPVYCMRELPIGPRMTAGELSAELSELAATMVREDLPRIPRGLTATPQASAEATLAPQLDASHLLLDWSRSARELFNQIRGLNPRPGAVTRINGKRLRVLEATALPATTNDPVPGAVLVAEGDTLLIATGDGHLRLEQAQLEGKRALPARDLINGRLIPAGTVLGTPGS